MDKRKSIKVIIFVIIGMGILDVFTNVLKFEDNEFLRIKEYYEDTAINNYELIFLGSSHVQTGIDIKNIECITGKNGYSIAVYSQKMSQSYYLLKEAIRNDEIDTVFLEMYSLYNPNNINTQIKSRVFDGLRENKNKYDYLLNVFGFPEFVEGAIPLLRYHNSFFNYNIIKYNIENYNKKIEISDNFYNGFTTSQVSMSNEDFIKNLSAPTVSQKLYTVLNDINYETYEFELGYFHKTIQLCKENGIEIILFKTPVISYFGNVEKYSQAMSTIGYEIAEQYDINYIDYNYLAYTLSLDHTTFKDTGHLNNKGAKIVTEHLAHYYNAIHDEKLINCEDLVKNAKFINSKPRSVINDVVDDKYGQGTKIEKIYEDNNYNMLAVIENKHVTQPGIDYLPYTASCIVKNISNLTEEELRYILTIYTGTNGLDRYQYRTIEHIEDEYYKVTTTLESNVGEFMDVRINSKLPQNKPIEVYNVKLEQDLVN